MTNKFDVFKTNYEQAIDSIISYLEDKDPETRHLCNWLLLQSIILMVFFLINRMQVQCILLKHLMEYVIVFIML
jgi:hypothetical protein